MYDPFAVARVELAGLEVEFDESENEERQYLMSKMNVLIRSMTM